METINVVSDQNINEDCKAFVSVQNQAIKEIETLPQQKQIDKQQSDQKLASNQSQNEEDNSEKKSRIKKITLVSIVVLILIGTGITLGILLLQKQPQEAYIIQFENKKFIAFERNDTDGKTWQDQYDYENQTYLGISYSPMASNKEYENYTQIYQDGKNNLTYLFFGFKGLDNQTICFKEKFSDMNQLGILKQIQEIKINETVRQSETKDEDSNKIVKETFDFGETKIQTTKINNKLSGFQIKSSDYKESYQVQDQSKDAIDLSKLNLDFSICVESNENIANPQNDKSSQQKDSSNSDNDNSGEHLRNLQQNEDRTQFRNLGVLDDLKNLINKFCGNWCGSSNSGISSQSSDKTCSTQCNTQYPTQDCLNCRPAVDKVDLQCVNHDFCIFRNTQGQYKTNNVVCKGTHACYCDRLLAQSAKQAQINNNGSGDCANDGKVSQLQEAFKINPCCCNYQIQITFPCGVNWKWFKSTIKYCTKTSEFSLYSLGYPMCSKLSSYMN